MTDSTTILVVSCPAYRPIQFIWEACFAAFWPDCPFPVVMLSPAEDAGWNANILNYLKHHATPFTLLMLEDHFIYPAPAGTYTDNMRQTLSVMKAHEDIGLVKLQVGNAWPPEIPFPAWTRLAEYDREPHPFKRTNLVPTMFRTTFLADLCSTIIARPYSDRSDQMPAPMNIRYFGDQGREGALAFEQLGTELTAHAEAWPERMLGIDRNNGQHGLLASLAHDGVREGKLQLPPQEREILASIGVNLNAIPGIERFL